MLDLALLLTHRLFAIPEAIPATGTVVARLADRVLERLDRTAEAPPGPYVVSSFHWRLRERRRDRLNYAIRTLFTPQSRALPPAALATGTALAACAAETALGPCPDAGHRSRAPHVAICTLIAPRQSRGQVDFHQCASSDGTCDGIGGALVSCPARAAEIASRGTPMARRVAASILL